MATQLTIYQARDGSRWDTQELADRREATLDGIDHATAPLGSVPGGGFVNGKGYVQHTREAVMESRARLLKLAITECDHPAFRVKPEDLNLFGVGGRILDDTGSPLYSLWVRLMSIDASWREWGQPYFARNTWEGTQVQLNP